MVSGEIVSFAVVLATFATAIFAVVIVPMIGALDCLRQAPSKKKTLWMIGIVVAWPFGSYFYVWLESPNKKKKLTTTVSVVALGVMSVVLVNWMQTAYLMAVDQVVWLREGVQRRFEVQATTRERGALIENLNVIKLEMTERPWYELEQRVVALNLVEVLSQMLMDGRLERQEYDYWMARFDERSTTGRDFISQYQIDFGRK